MRDLGILSPKKDVTLPSGFREPGGMENSKKITAFSTHQTGTHMNLQEQWLHAQGLHRSMPYRVLELKGDINICPYP